MVTEFVIIYQDVISQPIFFISLTLIRAVGYFSIFTSQVHQEMCLPHALGHYYVYFITRKQQNRQNNLLRSISLDLHTLTNASVWIHIQLPSVVKLNITIKCPNFHKFHAPNIQFDAYYSYFLFYC